MLRSAKIFSIFWRDFDATAKVEDAVLIRGHSLYRRALSDCRSKLGMRYLQPGRFLCPGPRDDAPFMWFFPADSTSDRIERGTAGALLRDRFEAYKADTRAGFFDLHFVNFDRQVVLVDVLGALHAGREAYEDTERALTDIAACLDYGRKLPVPIRASTAAGLRALKMFLPNGGPRVLGSAGLHSQIGSQRIDRLAFVATKADHVPAMQRDNLTQPCEGNRRDCAIASGIWEPAGQLSRRGVGCFNTRQHGPI